MWCGSGSRTPRHLSQAGSPPSRLKRVGADGSVIPPQQIDEHRPNVSVCKLGNLSLSPVCFVCGLWALGGTLGVSATFSSHSSFFFSIVCLIFQLFNFFCLWLSNGVLSSVLFTSRSISCCVSAFINICIRQQQVLYWTGQDLCFSRSRNLNKGADLTLAALWTH